MNAYDTDGEELLTSREGLIAEIERLKTDLDHKNKLYQESNDSYRKVWESFNKAMAEREKERAEHTANENHIKDIEHHLRYFVNLWSMVREKFGIPDDWDADGIYWCDKQARMLLELNPSTPPASSTDERERLAEELMKAYDNLYQVILQNVPEFHDKLPYPGDIDAALDAVHALRGKAEK